MSEAVSTATSAPGDKVIPLKGMRGMIASKMMESLASAAQLTHHAECDASGLLAMKARISSPEVKVSVEDLLVDAVIQCLQKHPGLNGYLQNNEILLKGEVSVAVAVALPGDLLVAPAILNAGAMTLAERCAKRRDLVERAKINKLSVKEMTGGTFTITNIGLSRVRFFTPILNMPQLAILGVGETANRPWVVDGRVEIRPVMGLSLTFDHRGVNGAPAGQFLTDLCAVIESMN